ncbi:hypothetical protein HYW67_02605 [Candidatus Parcubacteria bacterium]|nr:hypothetical protein [Candidatus Parcubacteria bacterium]
MIFAFCIGILLFAISFLIWGRQWQAPTAHAFDSFARCLASKGVTLYGADWCSHCQNEKRAFGSSFRFVPYVECPSEPKRCLEQGVQGYPTWILPGGEKLEGEQGVERLARASGCAVE